MEEAQLRKFLNFKMNQSFIAHSPLVKLSVAEMNLVQLKDSLIWFSTSGTTQHRKWIGLSCESLIQSAEAVNQHLQVNSTDRWLNVLPLHHVGGVGVHVRGFISQTKVIDFSWCKWSVFQFVEQLRVHQISLTALVPTQIFDLVNAQIKAPTSVRAIIVGGGSLSSHLYRQARLLGWPLLPSFGMTECSSQVATANINSLSEVDSKESNLTKSTSSMPIYLPPLQLLSHMEVRTQGEKQQLWIRSPALLTCLAVYQNEKWDVCDPKVNGWYLSEDCAQVVQSQGCHFLIPLGRIQQQVKIMGELVLLQPLLNLVQQLAIPLGWLDKVELIFSSDLRKENKISLVVIGNKNHEGELAEGLKAQFNHQVLPYERIQDIFFVENFPRTDLGKTNQKQLRQQLGLEEVS
ncbi:MAG: AMP-binding protein [Bdellovibrionales bacterium]|nr:AMP-binding protein [Bdellovibrionales bacterium]